MNSSGVVLLVQFRVRPDRTAEFEEALTRLVEATRAEPGCLDFRGHAAAGQGHRFLLYERWTDREALGRHDATPHLAAFKARFADLLEGPPEVMEWRPVAPE